MRTVAFQIEVNKNILDNDLNKLRTSINNLQKDHSAYQSYMHVQDDALKVVLDIEKYLLLQLMRDSDDIA